MKLTKNLIAAAVGSALLLGQTALAQEKKDDKPAAPPAAPKAPGAPAAPGAAARPMVRDRITAYAQYLKLSDEQKEKVKPILDEEIAQQQAVRVDKTLTPETRMAKLKEVRDSITAKVKPILNEEQVDKWMKMRNPRPAGAGAPGAGRPGAPGSKAPSPATPAPAAPAK